MVSADLRSEGDILVTGGRPAEDMIRSSRLSMNHSDEAVSVSSSENLSAGTIVEL